MRPHSKASPPSSGRLFSEAHSSATPAGVYTAHVDGASRGNPGPASYAVIVRAPDGKPVLELGKYLGRETNNVAEYYALITALDYAASHGLTRLRVRSDSELLVRQMQGRYKVKSPDLRPLFERALKLSRSLEFFAIEHVPREMNRDADRLANEALDRTGGKPAAPPAVTSEGSGAKSRSGSLKSQTLRVRAHYVKGVLVPLEPLDLDEGAEVSFELRKPR
ncbi:MAG: reverse transcriptase-like protein [Candidatus Acidiferrales bacterium]